MKQAPTLCMNMLRLVLQKKSDPTHDPTPHTLNLGLAGTFVCYVFLIVDLVHQRFENRLLVNIEVITFQNNLELIKGAVTVGILLLAGSLVQHRMVRKYTLSFCFDVVIKFLCPQFLAIIKTAPMILFLT